MNKISPKIPRWELLLKIFLATVLLAAGWKLWMDHSEEAGVGTTRTDRDQFVICLSEKGVKMYGSDICEFCQAQKKIFGSSFEKINYVNCDFDKQICQEKGITAYPVWEISGKLDAGIASFDKLANATGCVAPK